MNFDAFSNAVDIFFAVALICVSCFALLKLVSELISTQKCKKKYFENVNKMLYCCGIKHVGMYKNKDFLKIKNKSDFLIDDVFAVDDSYLREDDCDFCYV